MTEKKGQRDRRRKYTTPELRKGENLRKITAQTGSSRSMGK